MILCRRSGWPGGREKGVAQNDLGNELEVYQRGTSGTYLDQTTLPVTNNAWHHLHGIHVQPDRDARLAERDLLHNIGSRLNSPLQYVGLLDELRISDRILDPSEFLFVPEPTLFPVATAAALLLLTLRRRRASMPPI